MAPETYARWDIVEELDHNPEDATLYLEACVDEDPGDGSLIRAALGDIARARKVSRLAHDTGLNRGNLYKALSPEGNPSFATVLKIARALGFEFHIKAAKAESERRDEGKVPASA